MVASVFACANTLTSQGDSVRPKAAADACGGFALDVFVAARQIEHVVTIEQRLAELQRCQVLEPLIAEQARHGVTAQHAADAVVINPERF